MERTHTPIQTDRNPGKKADIFFTFKFESNSYLFRVLTLP